MLNQKSWSEIMPQVNVTELRNRLPYYLQQVKNGVELHISSHGENIAQLIPEHNNVEAAQTRLDQLKGTMIIKDIVNTDPVKWNADADNL